MKTLLGKCLKQCERPAPRTVCSLLHIFKRSFFSSFLVRSTWLSCISLFHLAAGPQRSGAIEMLFFERKIMRALRVKSMKEKGGGSTKKEGPQGTEEEEEEEEARKRGIWLSTQFDENSFTLYSVSATQGGNKASVLSDWDTLITFSDVMKQDVRGSGEQIVDLWGCVCVYMAQNRHWVFQLVNITGCTVLLRCSCVS